MRVLLMAMVAWLLVGCYGMRPSDGAGEVGAFTGRTIRAEDVALPAGYRAEAIASGLTFPTGVAFDETGGIYVVESGYSYGESFTTPRLLRIEPDGRTTVLATGENDGPWTGVAFHRDAFYVAAGGQKTGGRLLRIDRAGGRPAILVGDLPGYGDHHVNGPAIGPDGLLYFGIGTATNAGIVGEDNAQFGWLKRFPQFHDIPCRDVTLAGTNVTTPNPLKPGETATTGAYVPLGTATRPGQVIPGRLPCSGAVFRVSPQGGTPELVAWGFRNPFGLAFTQDGRLYVADNLYDERGSRPVFGAGDLLWHVVPGGWHGWPDYHGARPVHQGTWYQPPGGSVPPPILAVAPGQPPRPAAILGVHAAAAGFDFARSAGFGHVGEAFIAEFGDQAPATGKVSAPVGAKVVRVDASTGRVEEFMSNRGPEHGPASKLGSGGIERPVAARFDPSGRALYVVDFGVLRMMGNHSVPQQGTGVLWRVTRQ